MQQQSNMNIIRVERSKLLTAVTENRDNHRAKFLQAQEGYRKAAIRELDKMLADARAGNRIRRTVSLPEPTDHTQDYDRAIRMLEMCADDWLMISDDDFQRLVMDEWGWKQSWSATNSTYGVQD